MNGILKVPEWPHELCGRASDDLRLVGRGSGGPDRVDHLGLCGTACPRLATAVTGPSSRTPPQTEMTLDLYIRTGSEKDALTQGTPSLAGQWP